MDNDSAIRAYRKVGFEVSRELKCFELKVADLVTMPAESGLFTIGSMDRQVVSSLAEYADWLPSWENSFGAIGRIPDDLIVVGAFDGETCIGGSVYMPTLNWIMTIVVRPSHRRQGVGAALMRHLVRSLPDDVDAVKLLNVDTSDSGIAEFLARLGFEPLVDQYEMVRPV